MIFNSFSLLCMLVLGATGIPTHVVHESRSNISIEQWKLGDRIHPDTFIPVRVGLVQQNLDKGHDKLMEISDPASVSYGKHLTAEEVIEFFAPSADSIKAVKLWIESAGFNPVSLSTNKQWIQFEATAAQLESLLHAKYHVWHHLETNEKDVACPAYYVPYAIRHHIDYITPGIRLRSFATQPITETELEKRNPEPTKSPPPFSGVKNCNSLNMTPQCIAATYNITENHSKQKGNEIGIYETEGDVFRQYDLDIWTKKYYPRIPQGFAPTHLSVDHANLTYNERHYGDGETMLDVEMALPIIYPQGYKIWQVNHGSNPDLPGLFNTWLDALDGSYCNYTAYGITGDSPGIDPQYKHPLQCGIYKPTNVMSISWGTAEATMPANYLNRQCSEYMKLGMQGYSLIFCSQDIGVMGVFKPLCLGKDRNIFVTNFPASCPYVTSVGSTVFPFENANILNRTQEHGAHFSGGGFSNIFATPKYQQQAVHTYLIKHKPAHKSFSTVNGKNIGANGGVFNRNGRGVPDVSAIGFAVSSSNGYSGTGSGTSYSTPIWAAIINRVNEERLAAGKATVGFINPALYARPNVMHDILQGRNYGCLSFKKIGFNVSEGWDPVTGLGSPSFPDLLKYFMSLP